MIKGVIFDLDGVIVSTDEYHYLAWKAIADQEGILFNRDINHRLRGVSRMESLEIILENAHRRYTELEKEFLAKTKNDLYLQFLDELGPNNILKNAIEVIYYLKDKGIKVAIGSSSKNTKKILKQLGITAIFDAIADGNDIKKSKPNPEVFFVACERLGLLPDECAVIEDAFAGIEAAKNAGMMAIAINDAVKSPLADYIISDLLDIKNIIVFQ
jgi:beta-phosphoglucomutase